MKTRAFFLIFALVFRVFAANAADAPVRNILDRHNPHWDYFEADCDAPGPNRPGAYRGANKKGYYSGALMGNGLLGTNFYKLRDGVYRLNFSRSDITEQRDGGFSLYNCARLPIGYFTLSTVGDVQKESMDLSLYDAVATGRFDTSEGSIDFKTYVCAKDNIMVFETSATGSEKDFVWDFVPQTAVSPRVFNGRPADAGYLDSRGLANPAPERIDRGSEHFVIQPLVRDSSMTSIAKVYVVGWKETVKSGKRKFYCTISFENNKKEAIDAARRTLRNVSGNQHYLEKDHIFWWHSFYDKAAVLQFPDGEVERFYWMQYYKFACCARSGCPIVDLQGVWPTFDTPWPAIWVNLNLQLTYSWLTKANLGFLADPLWNALWENRANLTRNVTDIRGQEDWTDSAVLPRASSYDFHCPLYPSLALSNQYEVGNLAWTLFYWYGQCLAYGDEISMKEKLFPLLKSAVNLFFHIRQEGSDGLWHLPPTASPEYGEGKFPVGQDSNYDLANLRQALSELIDIDSRLVIGDPDRVHWQDFLGRLPDFQYSDSTGFKISRDIEFTDTTHRHYSHLFMVYPYHMLDWNNPEQRRKAEFSIDRWHGDTGYSHTGKAAMLAALGRGDEAFAEIETFIKEWVHPNTLYAESGPVIETPFACVSSLHEFYLQDWGDRIRVFYGCPSFWKDASFKGMRANGAFLVSAQRKAGRTNEIEVYSEKGRLCRIECDIVSPVVCDATTGALIKAALTTSKDGVTLMEFQTVAGRAYRISPQS